MKRLTIPTFLMAGALLFNACSEGNSPTEANSRDLSPQFAHGTGGWDEVVLVPGNPTCVSLGYALGVKFDPPNVVANPYGITFTKSADGIYLTSWSSDVPVAAVLVKGGPDANLYKYDPAALGDVANPGLHSPDHPNPGQFPAISHLEFCINPALAISKTAETSYDREWTWDIEKDLDVDLPLEFGEGDLLSVDYTVKVSATSEDINHKVTGQITIHNPAAFGLAASITSVTDALTPGPIAATVDCGAGFPIALASGATLVCDYEADVSDDATDLNTATVVSTGLLGGTATAAIVWGDPDDEIDECIDVKDVLEINGIEVLDESLGTVCAPDDLDANGEYEFTYTRTFGAGGDFALECDENTVDNVASFITNDTGATGSDNAGFEIFVICEEPGDAETAWAANGNTPGSLPYTARGNWATYVQYTGEKTVTLFAGQTINVGTVHFSAAAGGFVTITINLTGGWSFEPGSVVAVQDYASAPSGNPAPGQFDHKEPASGTSHVIVVPANNFYGVHAVVVP